MGKVVPKAVPAAGMILILGISPFFESLMTFFPQCFAAVISKYIYTPYKYLSSSILLCALLS